MNEKIIIRNIKNTDLKDLAKLANEARIFHLSENEDDLKLKINIALESFQGKIKNQSERLYIFVAEDMIKKKVIGCSMLFPKLGGKNSPLWVFKSFTIHKRINVLKQDFEYTALQLVPFENKYTELGGLVVQKSYRRSSFKVGTQLSIVRFIFISMMDLFKENLLVQFTPRPLNSKRNIFWESIGGNFINMNPIKAEKLNSYLNNVILSLFPKEPIYICLLGKEFLKYFKKVDIDAIPAYKILLKLSFKYTDMLNPFDGGRYMIGMVNSNSFLNPPKFYSLEYCKGVKNRGLHMECGFLSYFSKGKFITTYTSVIIKNKSILVNEHLQQTLKIFPNSKVTFHKYYLYSKRGDVI